MVVIDLDTGMDFGPANRAILFHTKNTHPNQAVVDKAAHHRPRQQRRVRIWLNKCTR